MLERLALRATEPTVKLSTASEFQKRLVAEIKSIDPWYYKNSKLSS
jgi:hypothetical protein